jgi:hypothetical protein
MLDTSLTLRSGAPAAEALDAELTDVIPAESPYAPWLLSYVTGSLACCIIR